MFFADAQLFLEGVITSVLSFTLLLTFCLGAGRLVNITGDVLLASGVVAYLGAFDARYRKAIIQGWQKLCKEQKIPCSNEFSLTNILGDQVKYKSGHITSLTFLDLHVEPL